MGNRPAYRIPFNKPYMVGTEQEYIRQAHEAGWLAGNYTFTKQCQTWLEKTIGCRRAILTHSCTAAIEMAAMLVDIQKGDEVIMPSYTFVSTALPFVLRGGIPVFVDIDPGTANLDIGKIREAVTERTKAIVPVHYAGVACDMDEIQRIAKEHDLLVIEDAAQAILSKYRGRPLGSIGHLAAISFHETKNVICGEGGALLVNDPRFVERAEYLAEKGTNRSKFFKGEVDKYTWVDLGSSYFPSEIVAAFLWAQLEHARSLTDRRLAIWHHYQKSLGVLESKAGIRVPIIPDYCEHNGHLFYLKMAHQRQRDALIAHLKRKGIHAVFHYVPLHSSPAGSRYGRAHGSLVVTTDFSSRLVRLPLWIGIDKYQDDIIEEVGNALSSLN